MNVISHARIKDFVRRNPHAAGWLDNWWRVASKKRWANLQQVRLIYPSTDQVGGCLIFDAPQAYRLIVGVRWATEEKSGTLFVKHYLSHADYDKDQWKKDCAR